MAFLSDFRNASSPPRRVPAAAPVEALASSATEPADVMVAVSEPACDDDMFDPAPFAAYPTIPVAGLSVPPSVTDYPPPPPPLTGPAVSSGETVAPARREPAPVPDPPAGKTSKLTVMAKRWRR